MPTAFFGGRINGSVPAAASETHLAGRERDFALRPAPELTESASHWRYLAFPD